MFFLKKIFLKMRLKEIQSEIKRYEEIQKNLSTFRYFEGVDFLFIENQRMSYIEKLDSLHKKEKQIISKLYGLEWLEI